MQELQATKNAVLRSGQNAFRRGLTYHKGWGSKFSTMPAWSKDSQNCLISGWSRYDCHYGTHLRVAAQPEYAGRVDKANLNCKLLGEELPLNIALMKELVIRGQTPSMANKLWELVFSLHTCRDICIMPQAMQDIATRWQQPTKAHWAIFVALNSLLASQSTPGHEAFVQGFEVATVLPQYQMISRPA